MRLASILLAALSWCACAAPEGGPPIPADRHPIVLIDIDTLRADHLGCYGYRRDTSPAIDALAGDGVLFEWAFSQAPNTPPSQGSILSGLYPRRHGLIADEDRLRDDAVTLAEALSAAGFTTAAWVDGGYMSERFGLAQGFATYENRRGRGLDAIGPEVLDWLDVHANEDFLLLIHTYDVHTPYAPPESYRDLFLAGLEPPSPGFEPSAERLEAVRQAAWTDPSAALPVRDVEYAKALYDAEIRKVDDWVAALLARLEELGLTRRATVVLLSDHGEEFQEHGSVLHEKLYAPVTRIPLIVRRPGGGPARRISRVVEAVDVMPTLLELVGVEVPAGLDGESLVPLLEGVTMGEGQAWSESPFFGRQRSLVRAGHQLVLSLDRAQGELFDYRDDPLEQRDLASGAADLERRLRSEAKRWERRVARLARSSPAGGPVAGDALEDLESLGYLATDPAADGPRH